MWCWDGIQLSVVWRWHSGDSVVWQWFSVDSGVPMVFSEVWHLVGRVALWHLVDIKIFIIFSLIEYLNWMLLKMT